MQKATEAPKEAQTKITQNRKQNHTEAERVFCQAKKRKRKRS